MKVLIIGSGTMGTGIAQLLMSSNGAVESLCIYSRYQEHAERLLNVCEKNLNKLIAKGKFTEEELQASLNKIEIITDLSCAPEVDLIIEAVTEDYTIKMELLDKLKELLKENTIFGTNTSSLSITELAAKLPYPGNVLGMHFFNPAPIMELIEVVQGYTTDQAVIKKMIAFAEELGKTPVVVNEGPGFVVNRMLIPMINEAICILEEGVASAEDIDKSMRFGAHHPMGPLSLSDLIGNDVVLSIMDVLFQETGDSKYRANPLLRKMVRANHLGRKTSKGFFAY